MTANLDSVALVADDEEFHGPRMFLRNLRETDIDERYVGWHEDNAHLAYYTTRPRTFTRKRLVEDLRQSKIDRLNSYFAVIHKESGRCIGNIRIGAVDWVHRTSDLVALIADPAVRGQGFAPEAIQAGNAIAFERFKLRKLYGGMFAANVASIKAYLRAGWVQEGILKAQYLVDGQPMDRVLVACFNPTEIGTRAGDAAEQAGL